MPKQQGDSAIFSPTEVDGGMAGVNPGDTQDEDEAPPAPGPGTSHHWIHACIAPLQKLALRWEKLWAREADEWKKFNL